MKHNFQTNQLLMDETKKIKYLKNDSGKKLSQNRQTHQTCYLDHETRLTPHK